MNILLIYEENRKLQEIQKLIAMCYPDCEIIALSSGIEALNFIRYGEEQVDICFTEIVMRDISGFLITENLRMLNRNSKAVLIAKDEQFALEGWQHGMNDYLIEPITLESVRHTLVSCAFQYEVSMKKPYMEDYTYKTLCQETHTLLQERARLQRFIEGTCFKGKIAFGKKDVELYV